ncbi:MAG: NAD-dependent epimerase/dehydratase family protein [Lentisphaeria bacterium]|nr:NAD-dependent epimerase/dehydratase family protein [Lentisphaeria bacterium]
MKYLITGGAGFIGSHLTAALLARGEDVVVADNFSTGSRENLFPVNGRSAEVLEIDVATEKERLRELVKAADVIFHLAAAVGVELVVNDPVRTIETNIDGSANIITLAAEYGKRLFIASTSEVYGKSAREEFSEDDDLLIGSPLNSRWSYACSKLMDEFYLMAYVRAAKLPGTVVRFFNTVGPRQTGRYGMVIPRFVRNALAGKNLQVYGDGGQSRCFCHVEDVVRALLLLLEKPEAVGNVYNIGSQHLVTIKELAEEVIRLTGSCSGIDIVPYDVAYAEGFEDMRRRKPSTAKLRSLTGWRAEKSLEEIILDVAEFEKSR